jgi:hypothetical protein
MDIAKYTVKRGVVWLLLGMLGGGVAADWWERQRAASDIAELKLRQADQLKEMDAKIRELADQLKAERQRREALERALTELRKGS